MKELTVKDYKIISKFLNNNNEDSCEDTFVNFFVWQKPYNSFYEIYDDCLIIYSIVETGKLYRLPFTKDFKKGFEKIIELNNGKLPRIWSPDGAAFEKFKELYGDKYNFFEDRDGFDYIYLKDDLANLSGKKYHSKRNHISSFSKKYKWRYEAINDSNKSKIIACVEEWYFENKEKLDKYSMAEKEGILKILENLEELNVIGGAIFVDEKVVAFSLGSPINEKTFNVFFEKALAEYAQAYSVINKEFAVNGAAGYIYINREDDMGIEGLRKAKLSYKPVKLLKKFLCIPR